MLAYTAADSLNAITRTYDIGSRPTIVDRMKLAFEGGTASSAVHSLYRRTLGRFRSPHRA